MSRMRHLRNLGLVVGVWVLGMSVAMAADEICRIEKLRAFTQHSACVSKANIKGVRKDLPGEEIQDRVEQCRTELIAAFERAETRALNSGRECPTLGDADAVHEGVVTACCPLCGCE